MRRLAALAALLILLLAACKRHPKQHVASVPASAPLASVVKMNDPDTAAQLLTGFYAVEDNSWRWVSRSFSVTLRPPPRAAQSGAQLNLKFNVPAGLVQQGPATLQASVAGQPLMPETYSDAGNHSYVRDLPAAALSSDVVINFTCDKALPPMNGDVRELALIAVSVSLDSK